MLSPDDGTWHQVLSSVRHDAYHLPGYVSMEARRMAGTAALFVYEEDRRAFLVPLVLRAVPGTDLRDACSPYGYPGPLAGPSADRGFLRRASSALRDRLADAGVVSCFVRMHPLLPLDEVALGSVGLVVQHGRTVSVDLTLSDEEHRAQLRENHRRQILRSRRAGATVTVDAWDRIGEFLEMYHETMRRVRASDFYFFPASYFAELREALGPAVHLVLVDLPGSARPLGGGIFLEQGGIVQYHLGATPTEALRHQPTKIMFDEVRRWARARNNVFLHLGGGVQIGEENPLFHFKMGFSRDTRPFHTWRIVVNPSQYTELARAQGGDPDDLLGFFPAYRREPGTP